MHNYLFDSAKINILTNNFSLLHSPRIQPPVSSSISVQMDLRFLITLSILGTIVSTTECLRKEQEWRRDKICGPTSPHLRGNPLLVETQSGKIQGVQSVSRGGKEFIKFLGIPFAQPPVGKLRFEVNKYVRLHTL